MDLGPIKSPALPNSGRAMSRTGRQVSRAGSPGWSPGWSPRSPGAMAVLRIFGQNIIDNVLSWKKKENLTIMDYVINIKESIIHLSLPKFRKCWKNLDINPGLLKLQMGMPNFFFVQQTLGSPGETGWSHSWDWENIELWGMLRRPFKIQGDGPE